VARRQKIRFVHRVARQIKKFCVVARRTERVLRHTYSIFICILCICYKIKTISHGILVIRKT
jgi:hypothetical protein